MNISDRLTQQQLLVILMNVYQQGRDSKNIQVQTLISDIEKQLYSVINSHVE